MADGEMSRVICETSQEVGSLGRKKTSTLQLQVLFGGLLPIKTTRNHLLRVFVFTFEGGKHGNNFLV